MKRDQKSSQLLAGCFEGDGHWIHFRGRLGRPNREIADVWLDADRGVWSCPCGYHARCC